MAQTGKDVRVALAGKRLLGFSAKSAAKPVREATSKVSEVVK